MVQVNANARKVRFKRDEHHDLNRLPSAMPHENKRVVRGVFSFMHAVSRFVFVGVIVLFVALAVLAGVLATYGISNTYFTQLAGASLQKLAGPDVISNVGQARLSLDRNGNLAFQGENVVFSAKSDRAQLARIGSIRIGLSALPLFLGKVETARLEVADVVVSRISNSAQSSPWLERLKRPDGLYAPGALPALVHEVVRTLRDQFNSKGASEILISNVSFELGQGSSFVMPVFESLTLTKANDETVAIDIKANRGAQDFDFVGALGENEFSLSIDGLNAGAQTALLSPEIVADPTKPIAPNAHASLRLRGYLNDQTPVLFAELLVDQFDFRNRRGVRVEGNAKFRAEIIQDVDKIEVGASSVVFGENSVEFTGAFGPQPVGEGLAKYRFELVSNDTSLKPLGSPEERISAAILLAGTLSDDLTRLSFSQIAVRTLSGQLTGQGDVVFGKGSPALKFALSIPEISIAHGKQLWPAIFAFGARAWVFDHVFDGTLINSTINVAYGAGAIAILPNDPPTPLPTAEQVSAQFTVKNARFTSIGDLPTVREASGKVVVQGADTTITLSKGVASVDSGRPINVDFGSISIPVHADKPVVAALILDVSGDAQSLAEAANRKPINALAKTPFSVSDLSGTAKAHIVASFPLRKKDQSIEKKWAVEIAFSNLAVNKEFSGQKLTEADGTLQVSKSLAIFDSKGKLNGIPATLSLTEPLGGSGTERALSVKLTLDDKARVKLIPGLKDILVGPIDVTLDGATGSQKIEADLTDATLSLPFAGWSKGAGISSKATFNIVKNGNSLAIKNLKVGGKSFSISGTAEVVEGKLVKADFSNVSLNQGDAVAVAVTSDKNGFDVSLSGRSLDLRALLKRITGSFEKTASTTGGVPIKVRANLDSVTGFNGENLKNVVASYSGRGAVVRSFTASANSQAGGNVAIENKSGGDRRTVQIQTSDGGALLRFMNIYDKMLGGTVNINLSAKGEGPLVGEVDASRFTVVGEPRLKSLVGSPATPDGQSLSKVAKGKLEVSRVKFERGNAIIEKGKGYLKLERGILRSEQIGLSYAGTLYDTQGRIDMVGTFMPAYALNRIFSALPILGEILGNGRDNGLIGITFKLAGDAKTPNLTVNPISLIAPGIFRQIFEFK